MKTTSKAPSKKISNVEEKLLASAGELLARYGPKAISNREIANHAGVNHGQIHHYFGSQRELLKKAITKLAVEHWQRTNIEGYQPLGLGIDKTYITAIIRCAIDGDLDLATIELDQGLSVPRKITKEFYKDNLENIDNIEAKSRMAMIMSSEIAWALLEPYLIITLEIKDKEKDKVKNRIIEFISNFFNPSSHS